MTGSAAAIPGPEAGRRLRAHAAAFLALLRGNGFNVGLDEARDVLRVLALLDLRREREVRQALRSLLCGCAADWRRFDELFEAHWTGRGRKRVALVAGATAASRRPPRRFGEAGPPPPSATPGTAESAEAAPGDEVGQGPLQRGGASERESLAEADLRFVTEPDALAAVHALAERLARRMRTRLTRRQRARRHGRRLDLRRTIHRSIGHGGLPLDPVWRRRRSRPLRLVILLDVSGSMSQYSQFFVRFLHGVLGCFREAEAFVFHTRLIHVSPALAEKDPAKAVERLALMAQGWSGGTRIGDSLAAFNRHHAARVVNGRTVLIVVSDGYDTGPAERLAAEMAALRRRTRRIVWLNPMKGWTGYAPEAGGMQAALPYVELFAPAHNLESLAALEPYLARL